jgi:hypothetical protein
VLPSLTWLTTILINTYSHPIVSYLICNTALLCCWFIIEYVCFLPRPHCKIRWTLVFIRLQVPTVIRHVVKLTLDPSPSTSGDTASPKGACGWIANIAGGFREGVVFVFLGYGGGGPMGGSAGDRCSATRVGMVSGGALRRDQSTRCLSVQVVVVLPGGTATMPPPPCSAVLVSVCMLPTQYINRYMIHQEGIRKAIWPWWRWLKSVSDRDGIVKVCYQRRSNTKVIWSIVLEN